MPPNAAGLEQFTKDIVDALRLYARQWLDEAAIYVGKKLEAKVFGFNALDMPDEKEKWTVEDRNRQAADVLTQIEQGGY
jgi:hypothetical protein